MPDDVTYYAVVSGYRSLKNPSGLVRRRYLGDDGFIDEAFQRDLSWAHTSAIVEWQRDALDFHLIEISKEEAERLIEEFRDKWGARD